MASEEHPHPPLFNHDDFDDDDEDSEPLNTLAGDSESSSETDDGDTNSTAITVAIPTSVAPAPTSSVTIALPDPKRPEVLPSPALPPEKKPIDDSRRLFQRLWTDEDEIELLQGFLDYTASRGTSGHHHDTTAFYDQIKSKFQLDFNKNQLVEKLRRLKKKYRNVLSRMSSGKEFVFKSPHDQATFEISNKIWSNAPTHHHRAPPEFDDDDQNPNPNPNGGYGVSHINLNNAATPSDHRGGNNVVNYDMIGGSKLSSRKRPRVGKSEDKYLRGNLGVCAGEGGNLHSNNNNNNHSNTGAGSAIQGLIEETVRNSLVPVVKELMNSAVNGSGLGIGGIKGVGDLALNAIPLNFSGMNSGNGGEVMDDKWKKQQILELEVYSKRLELVQDQISSILEELRSIGN